MFTLKLHAEPIRKHARRGRPKPGEQPQIVGYRLVGDQERNATEIDITLRAKGRFILATNVLDGQHYPDEKLLSDYKAQQKVERGFRFLKDPWFMVDSVFLKSSPTH